MNSDRLYFTLTGFTAFCLIIPFFWFAAPIPALLAFAELLRLRIYSTPPSGRAFVVSVVINLVGILLITTFAVFQRLN